MKIINPKTIWIALASICYLFYGAAELLQQVETKCPVHSLLVGLGDSAQQRTLGCPRISLRSETKRNEAKLFEAK